MTWLVNQLCGSPISIDRDSQVRRSHSHSDKGNLGHPLNGEHSRARPLPSSGKGRALSALILNSFFGIGITHVCHKRSCVMLSAALVNS